MSRKFNKTLIASAIALSAATALAGNQQSEAVNSEQANQDSNAAMSSTQDENALNKDSANADEARPADASITGDVDSDRNTATSSTQTENALNEDSANADATGSGGALVMPAGTAAPGSQATAGQAEDVLHPGLSAKRADELEGMAVQNRDGVDIGSVDKIVRDANTQQLNAIVSVGGVLGVGDTLVPMPLSQLQLGDDALIAPTNKDDDQMDEQRTTYVEENYSEVDKEQTLGELSANATNSSSGFNEADRDGDGYISQEEAQDNSMLKDRWNTIDKNSDQRIDRAEFSALENQPES